MKATTASDGGSQGHLFGFGSKAYRNYVLFALTLIYILNFVDRALLAVVGPDLVPDPWRALPMSPIACGS